ncbi:MAG: YybS family protein [Desulfobacteraceae bacterium]|nr:YybS family protein [Desulfobacteraceae bacterium]MBC2754715.1 YybS family protein [Desulfobacteraceae bacterium]
METANQKEGHKILLSGIALTSLICALSISIPILGFMCFLVIPLPAIYYRIRLGTKKTAIVTFSTLIFLLLFSGGLSADLFFIAGMLMLGFSMGEFIEKNLPVEKSIGYACGAVLFAGTFGLVLYGNISNLGLIRVVSDYIGKNLELTLALYESMGMPEESIMMLSNSMEQIRYVLVRILPSLCAAGLMFSGWLNLLLAKAVLRAPKSNYQSFGQLNSWKAPDFLVWGVIGCALMLLVPSIFLKMLGLNGMIIFTIIFFFQGIAIISFYFEKKKIPLVFRALLYGTIIIQQIFILAIAGIGFFDVWLNFRQLGNNNNNKQIPLSS